MPQKAEAFSLHLSEAEAPVVEIRAMLVLGTLDLLLMPAKSRGLKPKRCLALFPRPKGRYYSQKLPVLGQVSPVCGPTCVAVCTTSVGRQVDSGSPKTALSAC